MKKIFLFFSLGLSLLLTACTVIEAEPLSPQIAVQHIKIVENPENNVADFVPVCQHLFQKYGIQSLLVPETYTPGPDDTIFRYTTQRGWDLKMFMSFAHVTLLQGNRMIASGTYQAKGGMFSLAATKLNSTAWKMERVFQKMFPYGIRQNDTRAKDLHLPEQLQKELTE